VLSVGAFVEGELYLSWMHFFQAHSCCNVPDLASLGNTANVCVGSKVYSI
jgi:hypothetical protein